MSQTDFVDSHPPLAFDPDDRHEPWPLPEGKPIADKFDQPQPHKWGGLLRALAERVGL